MANGVTDISSRRIQLLEVFPENRTIGEGVFRPLRGNMETTNRRRFTVVFKAQVALDTLHGDKTVQEIAADRKVLLNQVSTRKRRAMDGLARIFSLVSSFGPESLPF